MAEQDVSPLRKFESSKMQLEWIVLVEDFPQKELQRLEVRHKHVKHVEPRLDPETGVYKMGGIFLHEAPKEGEAMKIRGVASVIKANSTEEALEEIKLDPYCTQEVWHPSTIKIFPGSSELSGLESRSANKK